MIFYVILDVYISTAKLLDIHRQGLQLPKFGKLIRLRRRCNIPLLNLHLQARHAFSRDRRLLTLSLS